MKKIIVFLVILLFFSCNKKISQVRTDKLQKGYYRDSRQIIDIYTRINYYKYLAFSRCIIKGANNSEFSKIISKNEINLSEFQGIYVQNKIDSIVNETRKKIIQDSLYLAQTWLRPEGEYRMYAGRKRVIAHCLDLYSSPELDSIVNLFKYNKKKPADK